MMNIAHMLVIATLLSTSGSGAPLQEEVVEKTTVSFTDPSRPGLVKISLLDGGITVRGYEGREVQLEVRSHSPRAQRQERRPPGTEGMKRIQGRNTGLTVVEEGNVMSVKIGVMNQGADLTLQVPMDTSLKLGCVNGGDIKVERVRGEIEVNNVNGAITLAQVSGPVVAHALNDDLKVIFDTVAPGKAMSFSSLNGNIDVTFPADLKANFVIQSQQGETYSDFDLRIVENQRPAVVEDTRSRGGRYRLSRDGSVQGTVNGGGPEIKFKNFNGNIYIRRAK